MSEKYAYYPGCSLHGTAKEYEMSTRAVCRDLGVVLEELEGWCCCGASSAHAVSHLLSMALPAYNLSLAESAGLDVVAPCAMCFSRLKLAQAALSGGGKEAARIREAAGVAVSGTSKVKSLPEVLAALSPDSVQAQVRFPLAGMKVACYYGCLLVRPTSVGIDDPENPTILDRVVNLTGASSVDWTHKTECCGASMSITQTGVATKLVGDILGAAKAAGADCVVVACPMCQSNLDMRQAGAEAATGETFDMPILYITQLLGLAFGHNPKELGIDKHFVVKGDLVKGGVA